MNSNDSGGVAGEIFRMFFIAAMLLIGVWISFGDCTASNTNRSVRDFDTEVDSQEIQDD